MNSSSPATAATQAAVEAEQPVRYVYMAGSPYSGSTLLCFLLNAHPECVSVGEAKGNPVAPVTPEYACSCGALVPECPFWLRAAERMGELGSGLTLASARWETKYSVLDNRYLNYLAARSLGSYLLEDLRHVCLLPFGGVRRRIREVTRANLHLARAACEITGKKVYVDASKEHDRIPFLARDPLIDLKVLHLIRDARGGTASMLKNQKLTDTRVATARWRRGNLQAQRMSRRIPPERWMRVLYSELCADVQGVMDRISDFLGVSRAPVPEDFRSVEHHILGNRMRLAGSSEIREDTSWRERLTEQDLETIARYSGAANRMFGYDWP